MKRKILIAAVVSGACLAAFSPSYCQTDYILQDLNDVDRERCIFVCPNNPNYAGFSKDAMCVISWRFLSKLTPGMQCECVVKWKFWTNHVPVTYVNYFGDWNPNAELARSSMYGGIPKCNQEFTDNFTFTVPTTPGLYRIRLICALAYVPVPSFYGLREYNNSDYGCSFFSEILFYAGHAR